MVVRDGWPWQELASANHEFILLFFIKKYGVKKPNIYHPKYRAENRGIKNKPLVNGKPNLIGKTKAVNSLY